MVSGEEIYKLIHRNEINCYLNIWRFYLNQLLTCSALNCNFSSSIEMLPKLVFVPLVVVPMPKLLLLPPVPTVPVDVLLLIPVKPTCENPNNLAVGPLHDANKLNKCRFKSFDNNVVRLSTVFTTKNYAKEKIYLI